MIAPLLAPCLLNFLLGDETSMNGEDREALEMVLPATEALNSPFAFYMHVSQLFKGVSLVHHEVKFAQQALSVAPEDIDVSEVWYTVIQGFTELGLFQDAYSSLMATPYDAV
jgi:nuclear pore complex protein Nup160